MADNVKQSPLAEQPIVLLNRGELQAMLNHAATTAATAAIVQYQQQQDAERRLNSEQAARFLGCTTDHLQKLHKRGLAYEKGKPNHYRLGDLQLMRQQRQVRRS